MSDKIETMSDWNARLAQCGCCSMPVAPPPEVECQSIGVSVEPCGLLVDSTHFTTPLSCADSSRYAKSFTGTVTGKSSGTELINPNLLALDGVYPTTSWSSSSSMTVTRNFFYAYATEPSGTKNRICSSTTNYSGTSQHSGSHSWPDGYFDVEEGEPPIPYETGYTQTCEVDGDPNLPSGHFSATGANGYEPVSVNEIRTWCSRGTTVGPLLDWDGTTASGSITLDTPEDIENGEYGSTYTASVTEVYEFQKLADLVAEADLRINDIGGWENANGYSCESSLLPIYHSCPDKEDGVRGLTKSKTRYRWRVPSSWKGSYLKITWDILTTPQTWTDWKAKTAAHEEWKTAKFAWDKSKSPDKGPAPTEPEKPGDKPSPPSLEKGKTVTWRGPGKGEPDDNSWIAGGWFLLDPPTELGTKRIVNIRYEAMPANPYGSKPEIMGEGYDPANP